VTTCPRFVMATEAELAEHGIVGSAFALPMPVAPEPEPEDGPQTFRLVGVVTADDYDEAVYAAEQAESGMEGQGYKGSVWVQDDDGEAEELRARVAELEAERVALRNDALSMRGSLAPADGDRKVPFELGGTLAPAVDWLVDRVSELEARLAEYERPADEDPIRYALTEQAEAASASPATPAQLRAEDVADLLTLAPAQHATADLDPTGDTILLEITATREQWSAWQTALKVDLARTTNRGGFTTSHATWRGIHVVISRWHAAEDGDA